MSKIYPFKKMNFRIFRDVHFQDKQDYIKHANYVALY